MKLCYQVATPDVAIADSVTAYQGPLSKTFGDIAAYGYDGVDSYVEQSGLDKEAYREYMLIQKAMEYLTEHVKVVAQTQE